MLVKDEESVLDSSNEELTEAKLNQASKCYGCDKEFLFLELEVHFLSCSKNDKENIIGKSDIENSEVDNSLIRISNELKNKKSKNIKNANVKCHLCGKSFKHNRNLIMHETKVHRETKIKGKIDEQKPCKKKYKEEKVFVKLKSEAIDEIAKKNDPNTQDSFAKKVAIVNLFQTKLQVIKTESIHVVKGLLLNLMTTIILQSSKKPKLIQCDICNKD